MENYLQDCSIWCCSSASHDLTSPLLPLAVFEHVASRTNLGLVARLLKSVEGRRGYVEASDEMLGRPTRTGGAGITF